MNDTRPADNAGSPCQWLINDISRTVETVKRLYDLPLIQLPNSAALMGFEGPYSARIERFVAQTKGRFLTSLQGIIERCTDNKALASQLYQEARNTNWMSGEFNTFYKHAQITKALLQDELKERREPTRYQRYQITGKVPLHLLSENPLTAPTAPL